MVDSSLVTLTRNNDGSILRINIVFDEMSTTREDMIFEPGEAPISTLASATDEMQQLMKSTLDFSEQVLLNRALQAELES